MCACTVPSAASQFLSAVPTPAAGCFISSGFHSLLWYNICFVFVSHKIGLVATTTELYTHTGILDIDGPHCTGNPIYVFPEKELRGLSPNFYIYVSVRDLCLRRIVHIIGCRKIDRPILKIYKSHRYMSVGIWETVHYNSVLKIWRLQSYISENT
jgi:hypothetical protein